jgi:hypothetical protein
MGRYPIRQVSNSLSTEVELLEGGHDEQKTQQSPDWLYFV